MKWPFLYRCLLMLTLQTAFILPLHAQHNFLVDSSKAYLLADTGNHYLMPDVGYSKMKWTRGGNKWMTLQIGFAPIIDYDISIQDNDSKTQVGKQDSRADLRSARIMARGKLQFKNPWVYLFSLEYKGVDRPEEAPSFGFTDIKLLIPVYKNGHLILGKIKEGFVYEIIADGANLAQQERILNPFFVSRATGIFYRHFLLNDRFALSAGWFKQWPSNNESLEESANTYTARISGLPIWTNESRKFVHMGIGLRYVHAQNGITRLSGRNEFNIGDYYVDTKEFTADHQWNLGIEQHWSLPNLSFLAEYVQNWTITPTGIEKFNGGYLTTTYLINGVQRPYDKRATYARRVKPINKYGALEFWNRISRVNLNSGIIEGGINSRIGFGINWWATQYWKFGFAYGISNLKKDGLVGVTNSFQYRIQWIY